MEIEEITFVGIDPTASRNPFTCAILDRGCRLISISAGEIEAILGILKNVQKTIVAVNAPPRPNKGVVRKELGQRNLSQGHLRGADVRWVEYELRNRGIVVSPTPSRSESCPAWMQMGFEFYNQLNDLGFRPYPTKDAPRQWLETHPHAAFCSLLGQIPLPKPTLEGRLQRQLALYEQNVAIRDPMDIFEEITRHKLLKGVLPSELIYASEELDALVAAFTAYLAADDPDRVVIIGDEFEGQIVLPVHELKNFYN